MTSQGFQLSKEEQTQTVVQVACCILGITRSGISLKFVRLNIT